MKRKRPSIIHYSLLAAVLLASCASDNGECEARQMLDNARISLAANQFNAARDTIVAMRERYPRALDVRREALLVLDSVEMLAALDSLVMPECPGVDLEEMALRAKFYERKIEEDAKALTK